MRNPFHSRYGLEGECSFCHSTNELTQLEVAETDTQHCIVQTLEKHTFEFVVWEMGQHMMALFDTYPEQVLEVELDNEFTLYVNREDARPLSGDFFTASTPQTLDAMKRTDSFEALNAVARFIN